MKALITGGAGFIGSHLVERLVESGHYVVALDDLSTGGWHNLKRVWARPGVELVSGSVLDEDLMGALAGRADIVFHLAAAVGVKRILDDPLTALRTNLRGTEVVLDSARRTRACVVVMSSSEIYGLNTVDGLREDSARILGSPLVTRWSYAATKALDETLAYLYWRLHELPTVIIRPFNIVGPRQTGRYGMVIPRLVDQALHGEPLTVHGDGSQTRCFCHVREAVEAIVALAEHPGARGDVFNIGNPEEVSIRDLALRVIELTRSPSRLEFVPYAQAYPDGFEDMRRRVPDVSRARELVGFRPRLGLDSILRGVIEDRAHQQEVSRAALR